jgi:hypothetical protein
MRKILPAALIASALAVSFAVPQVAGIATWKLVLAAIGLVIFLAAGRLKS